jgi:hypothetical protein
VQIRHWKPLLCPFPVFVFAENTTKNPSFVAIESLLGATEPVLDHFPHPYFWVKEDMPWNGLKSTCCTHAVSIHVLFLQKIAPKKTGFHLVESLLCPLEPVLA